MQILMSNLADFVFMVAMIIFAFIIWRAFDNE